MFDEVFYTIFKYKITTFMSRGDGMRHGDNVLTVCYTRANITIETLKQENNFGLSNKIFYTILKSFF